MAAVGLSPAVTARASSSATTGNSASRSCSRRSTCWVSHQSRPEHSAEQPGEAEQTRREHVDPAGRHRADRGNHRGGEQPECTPHDLLDAEVLDAEVTAEGVEPAAHRGPATDHPVDQPGAVGDHGTEDAPDRRQHPRLGGRAQQPGRRRGVVHVRREPVDQADRSERWREADDEDQAQGAGQADEHAEQTGAHWSTRTSWGSRPIRSMIR
jgi:hypothetical protein